MVRKERWRTGAQGHTPVASSYVGCSALGKPSSQWPDFVQELVRRAGDDLMTLPTVDPTARVTWDDWLASVAKVLFPKGPEGE